MAAFPFFSSAAVCVLLLWQPGTVTMETRTRHRKIRSDPLAPDAVTSDGLIQQVTRLLATFGALAAKVNDLEAKVTVLQDRNTAVEGLLTNFQKEQNVSIANLEAHMTVLENKMSGFTVQNATLQGLIQAVNVLQTTAAASETFQNTTSARLNTATNDISELQTHVADIDRVTALIESNTQSLVTSTGSLTRDVNNLKESKRQLEGSIQALQDVDQAVFNNASRLQAEIGRLDAKIQSTVQSISFYARLTDDKTIFAEEAANILFDEVYQNQGGAYNKITGKFVAPVTGDYLFVANILPERSSSPSPKVALMVEDQRIFLSDGAHPSFQAALHVQAGQSVWLRVVFTGNFGDGTYFSGLLVSPEL